MEIRRIGVLGAGTMRNGIAQIADQTGCEVVIRGKELKWASPNLFKTTIRANRLGRKTGGGWYD